MRNPKDIALDLEQWFITQPEQVQRSFLDRDLVFAIYRWYSGEYMTGGKKTKRVYVSAAPQPTLKDLVRIFRFIRTFSPPDIPSVAYRFQGAPARLRMEGASKHGSIRKAVLNPVSSIQSWATKDGVRKFFTDIGSRSHEFYSNPGSTFYVYKTVPSLESVLATTDSIKAFFQGYSRAMHAKAVWKTYFPRPGARSADVFLKDLRAVLSQQEIILHTPTPIRGLVGTLNRDAYPDVAARGRVVADFNELLQRM